MATVAGDGAATAFGYFVEDTALRLVGPERGVRGGRAAGRRRLRGAAARPRHWSRTRPCSRIVWTPSARVDSALITLAAGASHTFAVIGSGSGRGRPDRPAGAAQRQRPALSQRPASAERRVRRARRRCSIIDRARPTNREQIEFRCSDRGGQRVPVVRQRLGRLHGALHRNDLTGLRRFRDRDHHVEHVVGQRTGGPVRPVLADGPRDVQRAGAAGRLGDRGLDRLPVRRRPGGAAGCRRRTCWGRAPRSDASVPVTSSRIRGTAESKLRTMVRD